MHASAQARRRAFRHVAQCRVWQLHEGGTLPPPMQWKSSFIIYTVRFCDDAVLPWHHASQKGPGSLCSSTGSKNSCAWGSRLCIRSYWGALNGQDDRCKAAEWETHWDWTPTVRQTGNRKLLQCTTYYNEEYPNQCTCALYTSMNLADVGSPELPQRNPLASWSLLLGSTRA